MGSYISFFPCSYSTRIWFAAGGGFNDDDDDDFGGGKGIRVGQMEPVPVTVPTGA